MQQLPRRNRICSALCLAAILVMVVRMGLTWEVFSDTADEPYHIGSAISMVEAMRPIQGTKQPPLARLLVGVTLKLAGVELPDARGQRDIDWDLSAYGSGHRV